MKLRVERMSCPTVYAHCNCCGRTYDTRSEYIEQTSYVGTMETGKLFDYDLELRNCLCGSTLSAKTPALEARVREVRSLYPSHIHSLEKKAKA